MLTPPGHAPYAFDLVGVDAATGRYASPSGWRFVVGMLHVEDVHGWDRPVMAPLEGDVIAVHDGERDRRRLVPLVDVPAGFLLRPLWHGGSVPAMAGNHVVLSTAAGYVLLAHLRHGSVVVRPGQRVEAGRMLGRVGNSGNSIGPHLHMQVMNGPDPRSASVVPFDVTGYATWTGGTWRRHTDAPLPARRTRVRF